MVRLAILGCGRVVETYHLPAAMRCRDVVVSHLVDTNLAAANSVKRRFDLSCQVSADFRSVLPNVDCVLNALPNHLHHPVSLFFLQHGVPVLCEKPLATNVGDAEALVDTAGERGIVLAVGYVQRFFERTQLIKTILDRKELGRVCSFDFEAGDPGGWETRSDYILHPGQAGGGVLMVNGIHFLNLMLYWFGDVADVEYRDDNWGGVEANVEARFTFRHEDNELQGRVKLSKTHLLKNRLQIVGSAAVLEAPQANQRSVFVHAVEGDDALQREVSWRDRPSRTSSVEYFAEQLTHFITAVQGGRSMIVSGAEGVKSLALIEACYARRQPISEPWMSLTALSCGAA